ncbi:sensor histidine kinase [Mycobacteroides abscessus]|uniref:sensor histidine kinase n=1 Tax=Mycobacteroides abscessus TaxID=36809 RepID=UPI0005DAD7A2|nr:ATP-binding protein [Mycobacteroides abscessus]AMU57704.1 histidine kinase [Mycobacteroides abscessus]MBE5434966.1 hypothetical protein [Mycobacteroides abscessus]MBE5486065.1 hypothetical protein [Mycobacteroides abscessus]MBN7444849.1 DUF4118 domain-containing protein [Mycobacteroides abscessus subsp. abscessus]MDM1895154.1 DUF4118 domain-containing protein [Mycobacteroides abscessus]
MPDYISGWRTQLFGSTPPSARLGIVTAVMLLVAESMLTIFLRTIAPTEHLAAIYLIGILVISVIWRLRLALAMSIASAIVFDCIRNWPKANPLSTESHNLITHLSFLAVTLTASALAALARAGTIEAERRRREAAAIAQQQAALRRTATLVASNVSPVELYAKVVEEAARCFASPTAVLVQLMPGDEGIIVAGHGTEGSRTPPAGKRFPLLDSNNVARELRLTPAVCAPIVVDAKHWGTLIVGSHTPAQRGQDIRAGVRDFADLVATAIANAATREELAASRARIVSASDTARRRLERDLHDGAQQRLAYLRLKLGMVRAAVPATDAELTQELNDLDTDLTAVTRELQEFSRGLHPAILSKGLAPALRTLARRSLIPVRTELELDQKYGESIEIAAYYVVAEALANTAKHSQASEVFLRAHEADDQIHITISDNGIGGAKPRKGTGLIGLTDRVTALGGRLDVHSASGRGTTMTAIIPLHQSD